MPTTKILYFAKYSQGLQLFVILKSSTAAANRLSRIHFFLFNVNIIDLPSRFGDRKESIEGVRRFMAAGYSMLYQMLVFKRGLFHSGWSDKYDDCFFFFSVRKFVVLKIVCLRNIPKGISFQQETYDQCQWLVV